VAGGKSVVTGIDASLVNGSTMLVAGSRILDKILPSPVESGGAVVAGGSFVIVASPVVAGPVRPDVTVGRISVTLAMIDPRGSVVPGSGVVLEAGSLVTAGSVAVAVGASVVVGGSSTLVTCESTLPRIGIKPAAVELGAEVGSVAAAVEPPVPVNDTPVVRMS
jgi:hypothetical protein